MSDGYFVLGRTPALFRLPLSEGSDFIRDLEAEPAFPVGTVLTLVFPTLGTSWVGTYSSGVVSWNVDQALTTAAAVPNNTEVTLLYTNGTSDQVLAFGTVQRIDGVRQ